MKLGRNGRLRRLLACLLSAVLSAGIFLPAAAAAPADAEGAAWKSLLETKYAQDSYHNSLLAHPEAPVLEEGPLVMGSEALPESQGIRIEPAENGEAAAYIDAGGKAVFQVEVPADGFYRLRISYRYFDEAGLEDSDLAIGIDGKAPFYQAQQLSLPRIWTQEPLAHPPAANDRQPDSVHVPEKADYIPADESGMAGDYLFYLTKGPHRLALSSKAGGFMLLSVKLGVESEALHDGGPYSYTGDVIELEAEELYRKNDSSITGGTDRTDAATSPNDPVYKKVNILSGSQFAKPGQTVTWKFNVKESGRYRIHFRYMQESLPGLFASRSLYIDGQPAIESGCVVRFPYSDRWQLVSAADASGSVLAVDLSAGEHTLTLEVTLGALQPYVQRLDDVIFALNTLYRKIIMITSTTPDPYRDYNLEGEIPTLIPTFAELEAELDSISRGLKELGAEGGMLSVLNQTAEQLREFCEDSYRLQDRLSWYVSNISSISSLVMEMQSSPLSLDRIWLESSEESAIQWKAGFWEGLIFQIKAFIGSFFCDYSAAGDTAAGEREEITAWFSGSREQSELLQDIINEQFSAAEPGIAVKLKLVTLPLTQAVLAGTAPDVCLSVARNQPVNLGARGVLEDLSGCEGFSELKAVFGDNLLRPYCYKEAVYGVPITLDHHMLFYRSDILEELGLSVPEDWDQFYGLIPVLQQNNLYIGLPYTMVGAAEGSLGVKDIFATFLLQRGAELYTPDLSAVRLDDRAVAEAFREWTEFYNKYQFSLDYNMYNRFRTGEMPLAIASYATYNQLAEAAPEIKGMWGMAPIPGQRQEDGSIDRTQAASGTAAIMLKGSARKEAAWKFLKWWASAEAQGAYGNALEVLMGEVARYTPANPDAVRLLPWSEQELAVLMEQRASIVELPEVLGGYYVVRSIDNAFRSVLYDGANYKEALLTQNVIINTELERKQREFAD